MAVAKNPAVDRLRKKVMARAPFRSEMPLSSVWFPVSVGWVVTLRVCPPVGAAGGRRRLFPQLPQDAHVLHVLAQ
ncbi:hypothetical protein PSAL_035740 (plasmid) [Pseudooceanicola algae]|uniref:Uncharacterized protein n=1 Tax=Pseudooceanicola algae TaxID=1537215 RepID=A0A418SD20_9RHOB|nr:hypothetical protein PSAL_035740 [Pseudooceanicola algae]